MTLTAITLAVLLHGRASEPPVPVMDFTTGAACARAMKPVQEGLRFDWPAAVTVCRVTGAPLVSPRPRGKP